MDQVIINGIFFVMFLLIGIFGCYFQRKIVEELKKLKKDFNMTEKQAKKYTILTPLFYFRAFNISSLFLYFASAGIFLYFFIKTLLAFIKV